MGLIGFVIDALMLVIVAHAVVSWLGPRVARHPAARLLDSIVEPLLRPLRAIIPPTAGLDFTPMLLILILVVLRSLLGV